MTDEADKASRAKVQGCMLVTVLPSRLRIVRWELIVDMAIEPSTKEAPSSTLRPPSTHSLTAKWGGHKEVMTGAFIWSPIRRLKLKCNDEPTPSRRWTHTLQHRFSSRAMSLRCSSWFYHRYDVEHLRVHNEQWCSAAAVQYHLVRR